MAAVGNHHTELLDALKCLCDWITFCFLVLKQAFYYISCSFVIVMPSNCFVTACRKFLIDSKAKFPLMASGIPFLEIPMDHALDV